MTSNPHFSQKRLASSFPTWTCKYTLSILGLSGSAASASVAASSFFFCSESPLSASEAAFFFGSGLDLLLLLLLATGDVPLACGEAVEVAGGAGWAREAAAVDRTWWISLEPRPW